MRSSFNAILKEERAIVSDVEGTTRDWLESWASINGIPVRLFDTAGLRETEDVVEAPGVQISRNLAQDADVVLYLVDGREGLSEEDREFIEKCTEPLIIVYTKVKESQRNKRSKNRRMKAIMPSFSVFLDNTTEFDVFCVFLKITRGAYRTGETGRVRSGSAHSSGCPDRFFRCAPGFPSS